MIQNTAKGLGLDPAKLKADMSSPGVSNRLQQNLSLARSLKVDGTPVFIIGDQLVPGAVDEANLKALVAGARKKS
jgi:protein-disulfide isomerase